jgi:hypothetical protein
VKQQNFLVVFGMSSGDLLHLSRRCLTSFERRFSEEFEESPSALVKTTFYLFVYSLQFNTVLYMGWAPHLHGPLADVERHADFLVLFPIFLLTDSGTVHGSSACTAGKGRYFFQCYSLAAQAGLGHDSPWVGVPMTYVLLQRY